jgi:putative ABC transport system permease protein
VVRAIVVPPPDPSQVARQEYRIRLHLDQLQQLSASGDRVDRFAVQSAGGSAATRALGTINDAAFGFRAYRSADVAVRTSKTFQVVSRFHHAIAGITIVASGIFLVCLLVLRVDERRREIAALRLMGISRRSVLLAIVLEAAVIAIVGCGVGTVFGWAASLVINWHYRDLYRTPLTFALVTPDIVRTAAILGIVLGIGAGALAGRRLVRRAPLALLGR